MALGIWNAGIRACVRMLLMQVRMVRCWSAVWGLFAAREVAQVVSMRAPTVVAARPSAGHGGSRNALSSSQKKRRREGGRWIGELKRDALRRGRLGGLMPGG